MSIHEYLMDGTSKEKEIYLVWHTRKRSKMMKTRRENFERTSLWGSSLHEIIVLWNCFRLSQTKVSKGGCNEHFLFGRDTDWLIQPFLLNLWITLFKFEGTSYSWWVKGNWAMTYSTAFLLFPPYASACPSCCSCQLLLHAHTQLLLLPSSFNNGQTLPLVCCTIAQICVHLQNKSMHINA